MYTFNIRYYRYLILAIIIDFKREVFMEFLMAWTSVLNITREKI